MNTISQERERTEQPKGKVYSEGPEAQKVSAGGLK